MYLPLNYEKINVTTGQYNPGPIKSFNNQYYHYWVRALFQRAQSAIILDVPWSAAERDFLYYCLFKYGFVAVLYLPEFGLIFQPATLGGYDVYYQFTYALINNPKFSAIEKTKFEIHKDCEILKLTPDYFGIWDIIEHYAEKLAGLESAVNMSIVNSRLAYIIAGRTKAAIETLKKAITKISKGEPAVFLDKRILNDPQDKDIPFQFLERKDLKSNYLTTDQLNDMNSIINMFDAEIGIPSLPYQKKERLVTNEADMRVLDATSRATVWNTCLNESFDLINAKYNTNMSSRLRNDPETSGGAVYG